VSGRDHSNRDARGAASKAALEPFRRVVRRAILYEDDFVAISIELRKE
jgi:hypothetical protein